MYLKKEEQENDHECVRVCVVESEANKSVKIVEESGEKRSERARDGGKKNLVKKTKYNEDRNE